MIYISTKTFFGILIHSYSISDPEYLFKVADVKYVKVGDFK